jgi:O-antigen/teichoic acid export membrane protein
LLYFGSTAAIGLLAVGNKASAPLVLFTSAFRIAWPPFAFSMQKQANAREVYAKTLTYFLVGAGSLAVPISVFAREALLLFATRDYLAGHVVAGMMAFQIIADASYYIVAIGLILTKKTHLLAYSVPAAAVGCIVFNWLLVPAFGFVGAALANTLSYGLSALLAYFLAQREYPVPYEGFKIARLTVLSVGAWLAGVFIATDRIWLDVALKLVVLGGYAVGLFGLRIIGKTEVRLALQWIRRQRLASRPCRPPIRLPGEEP